MYRIELDVVVSFSIQPGGGSVSAAIQLSEMEAERVSDLCPPLADIANELP